MGNGHDEHAGNAGNAGADDGDSNYVKWATSAGRDAAGSDFAAGWRYTPGEAGAAKVEDHAVNLADRASEQFIMGSPAYEVGDTASDGLGPDTSRSRRAFAAHGYRSIFMGAYLAHLKRLSQQGEVNPLEESS